ncbi:PP2C family protein-serine/threonine phosphatase [Arenibaculum pallidiluteum]|uniref:PP2C family protein-serine/threonine phosphatase n=1 Tax=Arenibaculum pallidiluteum TaxID=2812559 RepID=UPI001A97C4E0|nr:SpoIIE family protein phosphatase [Arenibaculum pallidiluteum]
MSISRRILLFAMACVIGVLVVAAGTTLVRRAIETDLREEAEIHATLRIWERALQKEAERVRTAVVEATRQGQAGQRAQAGRLADPEAAELARRGIASLIFYDGFGTQGLSWPDGAAAPVVESGRISQIVSARTPFQGLRMAGDRPRLVAGGAFDNPDPGRAAYVASAGLEGVLAEVAATLGASGFILDAGGQVLAASGLQGWAELEPSFARRDGDLFEADVGNQRVQLVVLPVRDPQVGVLGQLVLARDVTVQSRWLEVVDSVAVGLTVLFCLGLLVMFRWALTRNLAPLGSSITALSALAEGDTGVEVPGAARGDEIGMIARSVQAFRDRNRRLRDSDERRRRQWHRQQEFIQVQMRQLADTLPDEGRQAFLADLGRIEAATGGTGGEGDDRSLAVAFEIMAERVCEQHDRLDKLVRELSAALETRTELFALQQQVEVARRLQEGMLPRGLPPRPDLEAAGLLMPAAEFDGGFYDYFALADGAFALVIGQPAKGGLASSVASATVRTSLRALLSAGFSPGDCLTRTARLLTGDENSLGYGLGAAVLRPGELKLSWAAAGVDAPVMVRRLGDAVPLPFEPEPPLDGDPERTVTEHALAIPSRATVLLVSPGIAAATGAFQSGFGRDRLLAALRDAEDPAVVGVLEALRKALLAHTGGQRGARDRLCAAARLLV